MARTKSRKKVVVKPIKPQLATANVLEQETFIIVPTEQSNLDGRNRFVGDVILEPEADLEHSEFDLNQKCLDQDIEIKKLRAELETTRMEKAFYATKLNDLNKRCEVYQQVFPSRSQNLLAINKQVSS